MYRIRKRLYTLFLTICILLTLIPESAFAALNGNSLSEKYTQMMVDGVTTYVINPPDSYKSGTGLSTNRIGSSGVSLLAATSNEQTIWNYLKGKGFSDAGAAGIMGNLQAESGFDPTNLENGANSKSGMTDAQFTAAVDNGTITRAEFISSQKFSLYKMTYNGVTYYTYGYGLAQWTYFSRKANLYDFWKKRGGSIGSLSMQLDFMYQEMSSSLKSYLTTATSVSDACVRFHNVYEGSADDASRIQGRVNNAQNIYNKYAGSHTCNHSSTKVVNAVAATCTANGYTGDTVCNSCGETIAKGSTISATGHSWDGGSVTTAPTCTMAGTRTYTCSKCGTKKTESIPPTGVHTWDNGRIAQDATCVQTGTLVYTCTVCKQTRTESIPATGVHTWDEGTVIKAPTCALTGIRRYTCRVCEGTRDESIEATGIHTWDEGTIVTPPTCTGSGLRKFDCTVCDADRKEQIPATGHVWDTGTVIADATCCATGRKDFICEVCSEHKIETIPVTDFHAWDDGTVIRNATCIAPGTIQYQCNVCGTTEIKKIPILTEHIWNSGENMVAADCGNPGEIFFTCEECGETKTEVTEPTGLHIWDEGKVTKEATAEEEGIMLFTCTTCQQTKEEKIPMLDGNVRDSGNCGFSNNGVWTDAVTWQVYKNGLLRISGFGQMCSPSNKTQYPWHKYCQDITSVEIESGVTSIGMRAFCQDYPSLRKVSIPETLTSGICEYTFEKANSLIEISVDLRNQVYSSKDGVLFNHDWTKLLLMPCGREGLYIIPNGVTSIDGFAFWNSSLSALTFPSTLKEIGDCAFWSCNNLSSIGFIPAGTELGNSIFMECNALEEITCNGDTIGSWMFYSCQNLRKVTISENVQFIRDQAFGECGSLHEISFEGTAPQMDSDCFSGVIADGWYPAGENSWTSSVKQNYGGSITWKEKSEGGTGETDTDDDPVIKMPFTDVSENAYYYKPVDWAVKQNITSGATATTFNPNGQCTRAQIIAMLWKAYGSPEPGTVTSRFTDVKPSNYYYKAVMWAVENGITSGASATLFGASMTCTRAQVMTFLWNAAGKPEPNSTSTKFSDVKAGAYYYKAVLWAVENGITSGSTSTSFGVNNVCTRGQVVTFLYKVLQE